MLAGQALVGSRVELQGNLVDPAGDMERQCPVRANLGSFSEALREAEVQQPGRPRVEPIRTDAHDLTDIADSLGQGRWQIRKRVVPAGLHRGDYIQVTGGAVDETKEQKAGTAHGHELVAQAASLEGLRECLQRTDDWNHEDIIPAKRRDYHQTSGGSRGCPFVACTPVLTNRLTNKAAATGGPTRLVAIREGTWRH